MSFQNDPVTQDVLVQAFIAALLKTSALMKYQPSEAILALYTNNC